MKDLFKCTVPDCNKVYVNKAILKRHFQAFHENSGKFQCKVCRKNLASRQNLKEHSFIHSGLKPYACKELGCRASFRQGTHLSAHKKTHESTYPNFSVCSLLLKLSQNNYLGEQIQTDSVALPLLQEINYIPNLPSLF
jgi:uncharacterized Zn-finger protein